jgi:PAS domain-containing protein
VIDLTLRNPQCFTLCSASLPGNSIIYASEGFLKLTGYSKDQVMGRPALFLAVSPTGLPIRSGVHTCIRSSLDNATRPARSVLITLVSDTYVAIRSGVHTCMRDRYHPQR